MNHRAQILLIGGSIVAGAIGVYSIVTADRSTKMKETPYIVQQSDGTHAKCSTPSGICIPIEVFKTIEECAVAKDDYKLKGCTLRGVQ